MSLNTHNLFVVLIILLMSFLSASAIAGVDNKVRNEKVVLRTNAGDIVLSVFSDTAPKTAERFLRLVRHGFYDSTTFYWVTEDGNYLSGGDLTLRLNPITDLQKNILYKIPHEESPTKPAKAGYVVMNREPGVTESDATSFSILLKDVPGGEHDFSVFAEIERGFSVLDEIVRNLRQSQPFRIPIIINRAEPFLGTDIDYRNLQPPVPVLFQHFETVRIVLMSGSLIIVLLSVCAWIFKKSLGLNGVLAISGINSGISIYFLSCLTFSLRLHEITLILFALFIVYFRLMSDFENN